MIDEREQYLIKPEMNWIERLFDFYQMPGHQLNVIWMSVLLAFVIYIIKNRRKHGR